MWKCIFVRLIYLISFLTTKNRNDTLSMSTRGLSASRLASKRTLQGLIKSFLNIKTHYKYKSSTSWFLHIFVVMQIVIMSDGLETLYTVQNLHCDSDSWIIKTKTFQELFNPIESLHVLNNLIPKRYFLRSDSYWLLAAFHFRTLIFISFRPFIIHLLLHALCLASNASDSALLVLALYSLISFFCKRLQQALNSINVFFK